MIERVQPLPFTVPAIVLVRPKEEGNVGAAARAMANMGLSRLLLVEPAAPLGPTARAFAAGAGAILDAAERHLTWRRRSPWFRWWWRRAPKGSSARYRRCPRKPAHPAERSAGRQRPARPRASGRLLTSNAASLCRHPRPAQPTLINPDVRWVIGPGRPPRERGAVGPASRRRRRSTACLGSLSPGAATGFAGDSTEGRATCAPLRPRA
jgi:hypothetical protein